MDIHISLKPETLWSLNLGPLGDLNITNSFLTMVIVMALLVIGGGLIARRARLVPGNAQSIFEIVVEFLLNLVESTAGKRVGRRIFPLIGALFFFIIVANYSGLVPFVGTFGRWETEETETAALVASASTNGNDVVMTAAEEGEHKKILTPFFRSPSADLNMTLAMALITFTVVQIAGISAHGVVGRFKHMADPPFLFPIELISELARIISLTFRLFGNIFAGEVLVAVMYAMSAAIIEKTKYIAWFAAAIPTIFLLLEVLFGFIQALVFALLTLIYITLATAGAHRDEEHGHGAEGHVVPAGAAAGD